MNPQEQAVLEHSRVGRLGTVSAETTPHVVPLCFAIVEDSDKIRIVSAIDEKPKKTQNIKRLRNIKSNDRVTLLLDRYDDNWENLAWVMIHGTATIRQPGDEIHERGVSALREKYHQYSSHDLENRPLIDIEIVQTQSWGELTEWFS